MGDDELVIKEFLDVFLDRVNDLGDGWSKEGELRLSVERQDRGLRFS